MAAVISKQIKSWPNIAPSLIVVAVCILLFSLSLAAYFAIKMDEICNQFSVAVESEADNADTEPGQLEVVWNLITSIFMPLHSDSGTLAQSQEEETAKQQRTELCSQSPFHIFIFTIKEHFINDVASVAIASIFFCNTVIVRCWDILFANVSIVVMVLTAGFLVWGISKLRVTYQKHSKRGWERKHNLTVDLWNTSSSSKHSENDLTLSSKYQMGVTHSANNQKVKTQRHFKTRLASSLLILALSAASISIPWEFVRLYQKAVAERAARILLGAPPECHPDTMSFYASFKSLLRWQFSWTHGHDPCIDYHYALLVDPLWEVTPLMVLSSVLTRCLLHPVELITHTLGRSLRSFFSEIPIQWQPIIMLAVIILILVVLLMTCRYRLSIPMLLRIEPRSPVSSPAHNKKNGVVPRQGRNGCNCTGQEFPALRNSANGYNDSHQSGRNDFHSISLPCTDHSLNVMKTSLSRESKLPHRTYETHKLSNILEAPKFKDVSRTSNRSLNSPSSLRSNGVKVAKEVKAVTSGTEHSVKKRTSRLKAEESVGANKLFSNGTVSQKSRKNTAKSTASKKKKSHDDMLWTPSGDVYVLSDSD